MSEIPMPFWRRALAAVVASRPVTWMYLNVCPHLDRPLLQWSRGWLSTVPGQVMLLETVGARSGERRRSPLVCAGDGDDLILVASNGGGARHPAWCHNLRKQPRATCTFRGRHGPFDARELEGAERDDAWRKAVDVYPGYQTYETRAVERLIPVFRLTPSLD